MKVDKDFQSLCEAFVMRLTQDTRDEVVKWDRKRFGNPEDDKGEPFFTLTIGQYELTLMNSVRWPIWPFGKAVLSRVLHIYVAATNEPPRYRTHLGHLDSSTVPHLETLWTTLYRNENDMTAAVSSMYEILVDAWVRRTGL